MMSTSYPRDEHQVSPHQAIFVRKLIVQLGAHRASVLFPSGGLFLDLYMWFCLCAYRLYISAGTDLPLRVQVPRSSRSKEARITGIYSAFFMVTGPVIQGRPNFSLCDSCSAAGRGVPDTALQPTGNG